MIRAWPMYRQVDIMPILAISKPVSINEKPTENYENNLINMQTKL